MKTIITINGKSNADSYTEDSAKYNKAEFIYFSVVKKVNKYLYPLKEYIRNYYWNMIEKRANYPTVLTLDFGKKKYYYTRY